QIQVRYFGSLDVQESAVIPKTELGNTIVHGINPDIDLLVRDSTIDLDGKVINGNSAVGVYGSVYS
ncbi:MAG: hypothetical protein ABSC57_05270, partial [Syntrophales bacterium]